MFYGIKFSDNILDDFRYFFVGNNSKLMGINFIRDIFKRFYNLLLLLLTILKKNYILKNWMIVIILNFLDLFFIVCGNVLVL